MHPAEAKKQLARVQKDLEKLMAKKKPTSADKLAIMYGKQQVARLEDYLMRGCPA